MTALSLPQFLPAAALSLFACAANSAESRRHTDAKTVLVEAEVIATEPHPYSTNLSTLEIRHVFVGGSAGVGRTFQANSQARPFSSRYVSPLLVKGERGLWLLRVADDGTTRPSIGPLFNVDWPARQGQSPRYTETLALAKAMQAFHTVEDARKLALLDEYAKNPVSEVAAWAVKTVPDLRPNDLVQHLERLLGDPAVGIAGQIAADEILCGLPDSSWGVSDKRLEVLDSWVSRKRDPYDAEWIISRLDLASQRQHLDMRILFKLLRKAVDNTELPLSERYNSLFLAGRTAERVAGGYDGLRSEISAYLLQQIVDAKEPRLRLGAAYSLRNFIRLYDDVLRAKVEEIKAKTDDAKLGSVLQDALDRGARKKE